MVGLTIALKIFGYACFLGSRLELIPAISLLSIELGTAAVIIVEFTQDSFPGSEDSQSATVSLRLAAGSAVVPVGGLTVSLTASPGPPGPGGASGVCV